MQELTLHEYHASGNCYKIRLTAALLGQKLKLKEYDTTKGETRTPEFLSRVNANGKIPVLQIGTQTFLPESSAAMYYLADSSDLIPKDRLQHAQMLQWMFFEQYSHEPYIATLRHWTSILGEERLSEEQKASLPSRRANGEAALTIMERHLDNRNFFAGENVTLADIALYAYTHVAREGGFDLGKWPNTAAWCERVTRLPRYIAMDA